jgi:hypothetical protein
MNKLLVVFNTSEYLKKGANLGWYIHSINSILDQDFKDFRLCYSGFCNTENTKKVIQDTYGDRISYLFVDEAPMPVNVTANLAINKCVEKFGEFEAYIYCDSGVNLTGQTSVLTQFYEAFKLGCYGLITCNFSEDSGHGFWGLNINNSRTIIPVGKTVNLHMMLFDNLIRQKFGNVINDVHGSYCSESVFGSLAYSINKHYLILGDITLQHCHSLDFGSSSLENTRKEILQKDGVSWSHMFKTKKTIYDIINNPEMWECGAFYEVVQNVALPNMNCYENGLCKDPERLARFVKDNWFLKDTELNYGQIGCQYRP